MMIDYLRFLGRRYLGTKGQGIVEYAIVLGAVTAIGVAVYVHKGNLTNVIENMYKDIITNLKKF